MNRHEIERMARAWQEVTENRFVIPEEIPANERTAFHGAAAAAAKAGKKSFSFAGKTHPVTMKKDTATKIADQKEETEVNELKTSTYKSYMKKSEKDDEKAFKTGDYNRSVKRGIGQQMASDALKRKAKKTPLGEPRPWQKEDMHDDDNERMHSTDKTKNAPVKKKAGETAKMNPKMETDKKATNESVDHHNHMANAHMQHATAHESEVTNGGHDDHDYASNAHHDAHKAHKAAADAHKKHGGDSAQYKSAAAKAKSATDDAKEQSKDAGRFKKVAKPTIKLHKESRIRKALMGVLSEKENHSPNKDKAEKPEDAFKGDGAKQMKKDLEGPTVDIERKSHDDAAAAGRAGPNAKARSNDNKQGDKKIVNPVAGVVTKEK